MLKKSGKSVTMATIEDLCLCHDGKVAVQRAFGMSIRTIRREISEVKQGGGSVIEESHP